VNRSVVVLAPLMAVGCGNDYDVVRDFPEWGRAAPVPLENEVQVDEIVQVTTPMVDILWTIDNSCSMSNEQKDLTTNFPVFMDYFLGSGLDYHVGVTSTDIDGNYNGSKGKLRQIGGLKWLEPETSSPIEVFSAMATMGTMGSGTEKGLGGTYQALELNEDTTNSGFYRDEAALHTIIVSDEPDMTPANVITQPEFVQWYDSIKDEADMRTFSGIVDFQVGTKYKNSVTQIGGIVWDIKQNDWPELLERLGVQAAGLKREYFLSHLPVPNTIAVHIKGLDGALSDYAEAVLDPVTGEPLSGDWTYDASRNSITFLSFIPESLTTVVIDYTLLASQQDAADVF
jgi:hypothetical protein